LGLIKKIDLILDNILKINMLELASKSMSRPNIVKNYYSSLADIALGIVNWSSKHIPYIRLNGKDISS
jgi:hypothetical protein